MSDVEFTGWVSAKKEARTLKDLRDLTAWCDKHKIKDDAVLDYGGGPYIYVDFLGGDQVKATWIECGEHLIGDERWDVLIDTHEHPESVQEEPSKEETLDPDYPCDCGRDMCTPYTPEES